MIILCLIMWEYVFPQVDKYIAARNNMVKIQITDRGITNAATIKALRKVPRHLFVPKEYENDAYGDYPLPIGYGQTISQPYIVAYMTEIARPTEKKKALEIGTGSGYQAAVLAEIVDTVYTIEIIPELASESASRFEKLGYKNIIGKSGDGYNGWPEHAPFDIIIVTAAAKEIPKPLIDQLAENGRLVIPVGEPGTVQELLLLVKKNGKIEKSRLTFVRFVPFRRSK
ncbi:MAG: protein-L-isoaspartate(D-aspartate) O-methyltransferase, partial [Bacteroidia bacterium]|nr:protein-L-isoaspartate(D-aspartate) O-methyltransferase [Bacteroidia bacterium]